MSQWLDADVPFTVRVLLALGSVSFFIGSFSFCLFLALSSFTACLFFSFSSSIYKKRINDPLELLTLP